MAKTQPSESEGIFIRFGETLEVETGTIKVSQGGVCSVYPKAEVYDDTLISFADAGRQIGVHRETIRKWVNTGLIPTIKHPSGTRKIRQSDFNALYGVAKDAKEREKADQRKFLDDLEKRREIDRKKRAKKRASREAQEREAKT